MLQKILICGGSILFFLTNLSFAQESDLGKIIVTATRMAQYDYKIASNVSVINSDDIKKSNAQTIPQILEETMGIYVYDKNTSKTSTVDIRGFGDTSTRNILVLVNDRKLNPMDMSGPDLLQIPLEAVERIEIIRGAGSVLYGDNAVGGVINIITKKGQGKMSGELGGFFGSYSKSGGHSQISGEHKGLSYFFHSKYFDDRGYRQNSNTLSKDFNLRLGYELFERLNMDFEYGHHKDNYNLPGGLDENELLTLGRRGSADQTDSADTRDEYFKWTLDINPWPEFMKDWGKVVVDVTHRYRHVFDTFSGSWNTTRNIRSDGISGKYIFDKVLFNHDVNFVTGVDYNLSESGIIGSGWNTDDLTISKDEYGYYGFAEFELVNNVFANAGTRYQKADYTFVQHNGTPEIKKRADEIVSMGGFRYEYAKCSNAHINVQQTFRFLSTDEWYSSWSGLNTDLSQQTGIQYEAGVKHQLMEDLNVSVTPYWIDDKNEIFYDPNAGFFGTNSNYDKTRRLGVELGSNWDITKWSPFSWSDKVEFYSNYTYQNPEFINGPYDGNDIPMVPRHQAIAGMKVKIYEFYNLSFGGRYVGERYIINDVSNLMPKAKPYFVLDGRVAYEKKNWEIYVEANNLLDKEYSPYQVKKTATTRDYFPADEFNLLTGVNIKF